MTMARTIPGQSITQRLMRRVATRPHIGAKPEFFERLGVEDPLAVDGDVIADSQKEMFSFLSSAGYYRDLRASRFGLMSRIGGPQRRVAGERLRSVGPRAATIRRSLLASFGIDSDLMETFLETAPEEALDETPARVIYRDRRPSDRREKASKVSSAPADHRPFGRRASVSEVETVERTPVFTDSRRPTRRRRRPVERAMAREVPEFEDESPIVRAIVELVRTFRGRARREVSTLVERIRLLPERQQIGAARREMRKLRSFAAASTQVVIDQVEAVSSQAPVRVAQARMPAVGRPQKGLRRVLGESPALMTLEAPIPEAPVADPVSTARRRVRGPEFGRVRRASARREAPIAQAREQARTQQVSGRAGPSPEISRTIAAVQKQQTRRPTEWMASLAVAADRPVATKEISYGMAAAGAQPAVDRGTSRVSMRAHAGDIGGLETGFTQDLSVEAPSISRGATGWMSRALSASPRRRTRPRSTLSAAPQSLLEPLAPSAESGSDDSQIAPRASVQRRRTAETRVPRRRPTTSTLPPAVPPTVRALRRGLPVRHRRLSASPIRTATPATAASVAAAPPITPEQARSTPTLRASSRAAISRRSLTASPIRTALRAAENGEVVHTDPQTGLASPPSPLQRQRPTRHTPESLIEPAPSAASARAASAVAPPTARRSSPPSPEQQLLAPVEPVEDEGSAIRPTSRVAARATTTVQPSPHAAGIERPGMAVRAAARAERTVRRSSMGAMLSPTVLSHVADEQQAVEAAVVGKRRNLRPTRGLGAEARPVPATRNAEMEPDTRHAPRRQVALRPTQTATERASRRADQPDAVAPAIRGRGILAPVPTSYLEPQHLDESPAEVATPTTRRDRPTVRAVARAVESTELDSGGRAILNTPPTAYIRVARESGEHAVASPPVERAERGVLTPAKGRNATPRPTVEQTLIEQAPQVEPAEATQSGSRRTVRSVRRAPATSRIRQRSAQAASPRVTQPGRRWVRPSATLSSPAPTLAMGRPEITAAPMARAAARRAPQARSAQRSTLPRAINRSDLQYLVAEEIRQLASPDARPPQPTSLRQVLKTVAPAVQAAGRIGRSLVTVDAARRAVGDARGRRPNVFAHLEESPEGRIIRGQARRTAAPGRRRPLASPETVVLGAADFAPADNASPVEWSERRAARPSRRQPAAAAPARLPALRAEERVQGPRRFARRRPTVSAARTIRGPADRFTPQRVLPAAAGVRPEATSELEAAQATRPRRRVRTRQLDQTWGYLETPSTSTETARPQRRRNRPSAVGDQQTLLEPGFDAADEAVLEPEAPGWARRAVEGTPVAAAPQIRRRSRARVGGSLLTALARAANPEDVIQVILERSTSGASAELPGPAAQLVRRIAQSAAVDSSEPLQPRYRQDHRGERGGRVQRRGTRSVRQNVLRPPRSNFISGPAAQSTAKSGQGVGASNVMKLANKLMKLIHLAENERRADARSQVRMAEDTAQARAEGGLGAAQTKSAESETMNIQTLQQEVLESVLSAIELLQQRREGDPDGRNEWW